MFITEGDREGDKGDIHGITARVQLKKLFLGPIGSPRWSVAGRWGISLGVDVVMAETVDGILAICTL